MKKIFIMMLLCISITANAQDPFNINENAYRAAERAIRNQTNSRSSAKNNNYSYSNGTKYNLNGYFKKDGKKFPIKIQFSEKNGNISFVKYTNVNYNVKLSMSGYKDGNYYYFDGYDGNDNFSIKVYKYSNNKFSGSAQVSNKKFDVELW